MMVRREEPLAPHTSLRVGGPARFFIEAATLDELKEAARLARQEGLPLRILGAGTNILVPDAGVEAVVVRLVGGDISFVGDVAIAEADAAWDALVARASARGLWGIENLSGIPGTVGGAVVQNIGAYGQALSDTLAWVDVFDLARGEVARLAARACAFGYRDSVFKREHELVILRAAFVLTPAGVPNVGYRDLAERFPGTSPTLVSLREAVLAIRAHKFPDLALEGTAGSFFKNVMVTSAEARALAARYPGLPTFAIPETNDVKVPLAWLLDHVLHLKGFEAGPVRLFERQPLVIVTKQGAHAGEVEAFAQAVAARVKEATGITIEREVETFA